jgi:signal transduction histidine kinase
MSIPYKEIEEREILIKTRIFFIAAFFSSFLFYYFMTRINQANIDSLTIRYLISFLAFIGLGISFNNKTKRFSRYITNAVSLAYLLLYLYLLYLNSWSIFHRWSYFVVAAILCSTSLSLKDFIFTALVALILPIILGINAPISLLEQVHFHSANLAVFFLIGVSVYSQARFRRKVIILTNEINQQSKYVAIGEMAASISHEINNPLFVIKASATKIFRMAESQNLETEKIVNLVNKINRMVLRITDITHGLKEISSATTEQEFEENDLVEIVKNAIHIAYLTKSKMNYEIEFNFHKETYLYKCKKNQLIQLVANLCINSLEVLEISNASSVKVTITESEKFVQISVIDNGHGFSEEISAKMMSPFFTTKEVGEGLGLGLSIAKAYAKSNGGELTANRNNSLTTSMVSLPLQRHYI